MPIRSAFRYIAGAIIIFRLSSRMAERQPYAGQQVIVRDHPTQMGTITSVDRYENAKVHFPHLNADIEYQLAQLEFQETFGLDGQGI